MGLLGDLENISASVFADPFPVGPLPVGYGDVLHNRLKGQSFRGVFRLSPGVPYHVLGLPVIGILHRGESVQPLFCVDQLLHIFYRVVYGGDLGQRFLQKLLLV